MSVHLALRWWCKRCKAGPFTDNGLLAHIKDHEIADRLAASSNPDTDTEREKG